MQKIGKKCGRSDLKILFNRKEDATTEKQIFTYTTVQIMVKIMVGEVQFLDVRSYKWLTKSDDRVVYDNRLN